MDSNLGKLIDFLQYARKNHAEEIARQSIKDCREMEVPLLKLFANMPEEALIAQSVKGINDFVDSLVDGTYEAKQLANLKLWEEDKLPGISKDSISPTDLVLIYIIQKKGYFNLIPGYTKDTKLAIEIVMAMESLHLASQNKGINLLFDMRKQTEAKLELANKELEAFSYSVSHDLRAPLRAIHGFTRILYDENAGKLSDEARDMMKSVMNNTEKMGQLIDDLLAFSRLGKKELQISKIDMNELARVALDEVKKSEVSPKAHIVIHPLLSVSADFSLIHQVFTNLLSNAIKYSSKKDAPQIEVSSVKKDDENIYCVRDNGVGFNMKYYDKLFGVFHRLHSDAEFEGTGIGLALIKRIIVRHGGQIWAEAELNKGAAFYFSLKN